MEIDSGKFSHEDFFELDGHIQSTICYQYQNGHSRSKKIIIIDIENDRIITSGLTAKEKESSVDLLDSVLHDPNDTYINQIKKLEKQIKY